MGAFAEVRLLVRVSPLPITALIGAPDLQAIDLQPNGIVWESVVEGDLCSIIGADIVTRVDDWANAVFAETMTTWSLHQT